MKKQTYIDLMEVVMSAYSEEHIKAYTKTALENGIEEHGYPRLTANLGILIAHGRKTEYKEEFLKMMDFCCRDIPVAKSKNGNRAGNDFSVKEIVFCLLEVEKAGVFDKSVTDKWRSDLAKIDPYETYSVIASTPPERIGNWAAFGAISEQLRKYAGIGDESEFIENQIKSQLFSFDENGMYRDPNEPMVYDFVTRLQLACALYFGYDGESRKDLEEELMKSADITLNMQSVTGEIPFGGRSNQFLHNEAFYAALCEFYADFYKKRGDEKKAGEFKSAARVAVDYIIPWLKEDTIRHIKNYYATDSKFGCEDYAYFDKYMVTTGSWLYMAYIMADDEICEVDCPSLTKNYILETSERFHKVMCKYNDYFIEFDTKADTHYDASGLGRVHKRGAPSAICMSMPFAEEPNFNIGKKNPSLFCVCAGVKTNDGYDYTFDPSVRYKLIEKAVTDEFALVQFECRTEKNNIINQTFKISDKGVKIDVSADGEIEVLFPMLSFDGMNYTEKTLSEKSANLLYKGYKCMYLTNSLIEDKNLIYKNRNGCYDAFCAKGENNVTLEIEITAI